MPRIERHAAVFWEGSAARGRGSLTAGTRSFEGLPFSLPSRLAAQAGKTSPEELLAAAHGGCFATSLAGELARAGVHAERLDLDVTVIMDQVGNGHRVVASRVVGVARVAGADRADFERAVRAADEGCPFSALLRASATVEIDVRLDA